MIKAREITELYNLSLAELGKEAMEIKRKLHGERVYFVVNRQINPTNICVLDCIFCSFAKKKNEAGSYELSISEIIERLNNDIKEVHITGAMHPAWKYEDYIKIIKEIKKCYPGIGIKAFTAVEVWWMSRISGKKYIDVLKELKDSGVSCLAGGGAEVFSDRVKSVLFPNKIGYREWLEIHKLAHSVGLKSNATILYGHIETIEERFEHLLMLKNLQDETGGFLSFIPLAYQPEGRIKKTPTSGVDDIKMIAISRIVLDNFPHIKAYWVTLLEDVASVALHFGASDIDGTIFEERIMHASNAESSPGHTKQYLVNLIKSSGFIPVERDVLYNELEVYG